MALTRYDYQVLSVILGLTVAVVILLAIIAAFGVSVGNLWFMPLGWWVGAMMVWAWEKYYGKSTG